MLDRKRMLIILIVPLILLVAAGCTRYKPRPIDISNGEYYEDEEYQKLSKKDREEYCRNLAEELERLQARSDKASSELNDNQQSIEQLTKDIRDAERVYANMNAHVDELTKQLQQLSLLPKTYILKYGECLWVLASYEEIYSDPLKWPRIWRGNPELIEDPDWVLAGWELKIPREWPYKHKVLQDEWLAKIAGYWEVYDNYRKWPILFEANKDKIADPDLIFPDQELVIPREETSLE